MVSKEILKESPAPWGLETVDLSESFDKEPFRLWLKKQGFTGDGPVPAIPQEKINWVANLYRVPFEMLLGKKPPISGNRQEIRESILGYFRIDQEIYFKYTKNV